MSEAADVAAFGEVLRSAFTRFKVEEAVIRAEHAAAVQSGRLLKPLDDDALLERPTRRFLIDPMLRALDWNPDDPNQLTEEARSWAENGERLYFDYLGVSQRRMPTLLVEAKGADSVYARPPHERNVGAAQISVLISQALANLKSGEKPGILAQWVAWLKDLRIYVTSLGDAGRLTLKRVVITAGRWLIIFKNPLAAFIEAREPEPTEIHCYLSLEDIIDRHGEIYRLLARRRLIDTLPLTMNLREALQIVEPTTVTQAFRGAVVATRMAGVSRSEFPLRALYPALVFLSGERVFAVVDYNPTPTTEPRDARHLGVFLEDLATRADAFQQRVLTEFGRTDLRMTSAAQFPTSIREPEIGPGFAPEPASTAALAPVASLRPQLVRQTGERNAQHEFLVITGQSWFYKEAALSGPACGFHEFPFAKKHGVAGGLARIIHA